MTLQELFQAFDFCRAFLYGSASRTFAEPVNGVIDFKNHRQFVNILETKRPTFVAFTVPGCHFSKRMVEAMSMVAARYNLGVNFVRVNCADHVEFCQSRRASNTPILEVFHTLPVPSITGEANVRVEKFSGDMSPYGLYAFLKRKGFLRQSCVDRRLSDAIDVTNPLFLKRVRS